MFRGQPKTNEDEVSVNVSFHVQERSVKYRIYTVYPMKYAHCCVVLCFVVVISYAIIQSRDSGTNHKHNSWDVYKVDF